MNNVEQRLEHQLKNGRVELAKATLQEKYSIETKDAWLAEMQKEYNEIFPEFREPTQEEIDEQYEKVKDQIAKEDFEPELIKIDYSDDPNYKTFDEWLSETKVVKEAVLDEEGNILEPEVTELVRPYVEPKGKIEKEVEYYIEHSELYKNFLKQQKIKKLNELKITSNSVAYDANGKAIGNMSAVVSLANAKFNASLANGIAPDVAYRVIYKDKKIGWKNANNDISMVQVESIVEALEKSMYEIAKVVGVAEK